MMLPPSWKSEVQKSVEEHANADREQRQTEQSDASTKIAAAISSLRDAQNTQTTHEDANQKTSVWLNSITIFLVFLTVIFTGLSWCAFHDQLTEMRKVYDPVVKSANAARDAADAAKQQVGVAIDTEQRQLRAYIVIDAANITKFEVGQLIQSHITLKNTGLTPAYDIDGYSAIMFDKFPLPYPFPTVSK